MENNIFLIFILIKNNSFSYQILINYANKPLKKSFLKLEKKNLKKAKFKKNGLKERLLIPPHLEYLLELFAGKELF